ncbi:hydrogen peroxide-inducible genes activator [Oharaeibacter diazotrophicus]|uniref:LysR family transcriptional regulator n=1 Tax=Oharaeibacter diazotrophicus TaxID=1920512 RepID=A0A4R6RDN6_9HYPH|nr:hydrogen peroxide-inducible genes activator [Oharaeibacter diazotrophicus]TDP84323.1 LysR family transcriptional regulator [Oharaeibacter diazotrophicus]BBE73360.1 hydrogen peroxide-inducible genes activator [Pleomorphomonas sp. SM30]GLS75152.1 LysR family transcriptional regulator [Oharaeibacter diazotrophicus]
MTPITMKHLRYFDALARAGHFGRAAEHCAVTQPALSMQIKELEELVGAPLVERTARQIRLTGLGEAFAERARGILRAVDELGDLARMSQAPLMGRLRIGVIPTVAPYLLPALVGELARAYPGLDVRPREAVTRKLIEDLVEARLDAAIVALPTSEPFLVEMALLEEEFVLVRPAADARRPVPSAAKLREMRLLLLEEGHCFRDQALAFCNLSPLRAPRDLMEGSSLSTLVQMVGAGIGVTLVPETALCVETRSADVSLARLGEPRPTRTVGLVWRRSSPLADDLRELGDIARRVASDIRAEAIDLLLAGDRRAVD